jgi:hypothetical protein
MTLKEYKKRVFQLELKALRAEMALGQVADHLEAVDNNLGCYRSLDAYKDASSSRRKWLKLETRHCQEELRESLDALRLTVIDEER